MKTSSFTIFVATLLFSIPLRAKPTSTLASKPPKGFVDLLKQIPLIILDIKYHTAKNFTGAPLPGYGVPGAWMRTKPARALVKVQGALKKQGLGLLIYDAYRPARATKAMVAWAKRSGNWWQVAKGYIALTSSHNKGTAVDLTLINLKTKKPLNMGTPYDSASKKSHTLNIKGVALKNRLILKKAMEQQGFRNFRKEWWHYTYKRLKNPRSRDVPYACFEPAEGKWRAPAGWKKAGWKAPLQVTGKCR